MKQVLIIMLSLTALLAVLGCSPPETSLPPTPSVNNGNQNELNQTTSSPATTIMQDDVRNLVISILGQKKEIPTNSRGEVTSDVRINSADGGLSLLIDSGTSFRDEEGKPVYSIDIKTNPGSPHEPENTSIVGTAYEFTPNGTSCSRPLKLILKYNSDSLPPDVLEKNIYLACFGGGKWNNVDAKLIETEGHFAEAQIDHFCWYAILTPLPSNPATTTSSPVAPVVTNKVELIYFHPTGRCTTCKYFEERTRFVMATYFQKDVDSGQLTLSLYDYLDKANADLVKKYQVVGSQLFIKTTINGVENIRSIWEIYQWGSNADAFATGLRAIIQENLGGLQ